MSYCIESFLSSAVNAFKKQLWDVPLLELLASLTDERIASEQPHRERIFSARISLWLFLSQVLGSERSCQSVVSRFATFLVSQGKQPCSTLTGSYCKARKRLSEDRLRDLVLRTATTLESKAWLWKQRVVKLIDGTTIGLSDTPANQLAYPQSRKQKPGLGYPLARLCCLFSLGSGAALNFSIGSYRGKGQGELSLFRQLISSLQCNDIVVADRFYCAYWIFAVLLARKVDCVFRLHPNRRIAHRKIRLGYKDWIVEFTKYRSPIEWMERDFYDSLASKLTLRFVEVSVARKGYRTKRLRILTTLIDVNAYSRTEIADLYAQRWNVELDLRNIKVWMKLDSLRGKSPEMVRKEIWITLLAYNLIRDLMARAARLDDLTPRRIAFSAARNLLNDLQLLLCFADGRCLQDLTLLLATLTLHQVGNRPGRNEPRALKRRPYKPYPYLLTPRGPNHSRH